MNPHFALPQKVKPSCSVFGECGGCLYQDIPYTEELRLKETNLQNLFRSQLKLNDDCFEQILPSPQEYAYRNRLDLKLLRTKQGEIVMGFSPTGRYRVVQVDSCPIARQEISEFLAELKKQAITKLTGKYRVANLVVRSGDEKNVSWGGIGRNSLQLQSGRYFWTELAGKKIFYSLDTFFQANLSILPLVMERIRKLRIWDKKTVLFDLYGGVGLFSVVLADQVKKVILIEESIASLQVAHFNKHYHNLDQLEIIPGKVEDRLEAFLEKEFHNIIFIDPPRCGVSPTVLEILKKLNHLHCLLYLSCDPQSLVRDLKGFLKERWQIIRVFPFDFFPKTKHVETLVILSKTKVEV